MEELRDSHSNIARKLLKGEVGWENSYFWMTFSWSSFTHWNTVSGLSQLALSAVTGHWCRTGITNSGLATFLKICTDFTWSCSGGLPTWEFPKICRARNNCHLKVTTFSQWVWDLIFQKNNTLNLKVSGIHVILSTQGGRIKPKQVEHTQQDSGQPVPRTKIV